MHSIKKNNHDKRLGVVDDSNENGNDTTVIESFTLPIVQDNITDNNTGNTVIEKFILDNQMPLTTKSTAYIAELRKHTSADLRHTNKNPSLLTDITADINQNFTDNKFIFIKSKLRKFDTLGQGTCLIYAFLGDISPTYRTKLNKSERRLIGLKLRYSLSSSYYSNNLKGISNEEQKLVDVLNSNDEQYLEDMHCQLLSNLFKVNIIVFETQQDDNIRVFYVDNEPNLNQNDYPYILIYNTANSHFSSMSYENKFIIPKNEIKTDIEQIMALQPNSETTCAYKRGDTIIIDGNNPIVIQDILWEDEKCYGLKYEEFKEIPKEIYENIIKGTYKKPEIYLFLYFIYYILIIKATV